MMSPMFVEVDHPFPPSWNHRHNFASHSYCNFFTVRVQVGNPPEIAETAGQITTVGTLDQHESGHHLQVCQRIPKPGSIAWKHRILDDIPLVKHIISSIGSLHLRQN